jgi:hypothetical protein
MELFAACEIEVPGRPRRDQRPNHRARRVAPNSAFSAAFSREGS